MAKVFNCFTCGAPKERRSDSCTNLNCRSLDIPPCIDCGAVVQHNGLCANCGLAQPVKTCIGCGGRRFGVGDCAACGARGTAEDVMPGVLGRAFAAGMLATSPPSGGPGTKLSKSKRRVLTEKGIVEHPAERAGGDPMGEAGLAMLDAESAAEAIVRLRLGPEYLERMVETMGAAGAAKVLKDASTAEARRITHERAQMVKCMLPAYLRAIYCPQCRTAQVANPLTNACAAGHKQSEVLAQADYVLEPAVANRYWQEGVTAAIALMVYFDEHGAEGDYASAASHLTALRETGRGNPVIPMTVATEGPPPEVAVPPGFLSNATSLDIAGPAQQAGGITIQGGLGGAGLGSPPPGSHRY